MSWERNLDGYNVITWNSIYRFDLILYIFFSLFYFILFIALPLVVIEEYPGK